MEIWWGNWIPNAQHLPKAHVIEEKKRLKIPKLRERALIALFNFNPLQVYCFNCKTILQEVLLHTLQIRQKFWDPNNKILQFLALFKKMLFMHIQTYQLIKVVGSKLSFLFKSISKYRMKGFLSTKGLRFHWARGYGLVPLYLVFVAGDKISSGRS